MNPRLTHTTVRGTPIDIDGRVFVPEARVATFAGREVAFHGDATNVSGLHVRRVKPTALIEQTPGGQRRHRVKDATARALIRYGIVIAAIAILGVWVERMINEQ